MSGTLLLDSEGLSKLYRKDREVMAFIQAAIEEQTRVGTGAMTVLEADYKHVHAARIAWVLSRVDVHNVTRDVANRAVTLLREHGLHGYKHAIDAALAAIALSARQPVTILTSDPDDLALLCGQTVEVIKV
jgi:hypothetical protein